MNLWEKFKVLSSGAHRMLGKVLSVDITGGKCLVEELAGGQHIVSADNVAIDDVVFIEAGRVTAVTDIDFDNVIDLAILT